MTDPSKLYLPKLRRQDNFHAWEESLRDNLRALGLSKCVFGDEPKPVHPGKPPVRTDSKASSASSLVAGATAESFPEPDKAPEASTLSSEDYKEALAKYKEALAEFETWEQRDGHACVIIRSFAPTLDVGQLHGTAKEMYLFLKKRYGDTDPAQQQQILQRWHCMSLQDGEDAAKFCSKWLAAYQTVVRAKIARQEDHTLVLFFVSAVAASNRYQRWVDGIRMRLRRNETLTLNGIMKDLVDDAR